MANTVEKEISWTKRIIIKLEDELINQPVDKFTWPRLIISCLLFLGFIALIT